VIQKSLIFWILKNENLFSQAAKIREKDRKQLIIDKEGTGHHDLDYGQI